MTSIETLDLDEIQDLSQDEAGFLHISKPSTSSFAPVIIALFIVVLVFIFNTEWLNSKLQEIPYYRLSLYGLLFAATIIFILFFV